MQICRLHHQRQADHIHTGNQEHTFICSPTRRWPKNVLHGVSLLHRTTCPTSENGWFGRFWSINCCKRVQSALDVGNTSRGDGWAPLHRGVDSSACFGKDLRTRSGTSSSAPATAIRLSADLGWPRLLWWSWSSKHCLPVLPVLASTLGCWSFVQFSGRDAACFASPRQKRFFIHTYKPYSDADVPSLHVLVLQGDEHIMLLIFYNDRTTF